MKEIVMDQTNRMNLKSFVGKCYEKMPCEDSGLYPDGNRQEEAQWWTHVLRVDCCVPQLNS
jgi:hypothetical protein